MTQSQLFIYVFFTCYPSTSANPFPVPQCKPPRAFQPVPNQANSSSICRTRLPPLDRRGVGETCPRVGREKLGHAACGSLPKGQWPQIFARSILRERNLQSCPAPLRACRYVPPTIREDSAGLPKLVPSLKTIWLPGTVSAFHSNQLFPYLPSRPWR